MKRKPTDAEIRGIANSMQISGFPSTYESVKKSLEELYEHYDEDDMKELVRMLNEPDADRSGLIDAFLDDLEDRIEKGKECSGG